MKTKRGCFSNFSPRTRKHSIVICVSFGGSQPETRLFHSMQLLSPMSVTICCCCCCCIARCIWCLCTHTSNYCESRAAVHSFRSDPSSFLFFIFLISLWCIALCTFGKRAQRTMVSFTDFSNTKNRVQPRNCDQRIYSSNSLDFNVFTVCLLPRLRLFWLFIILFVRRACESEQYMHNSDLMLIVPYISCCSEMKTMLRMSAPLNEPFILSFPILLTQCRI